MSDWKNVQYKDGKLRTNNGGSGGSSTFAGLDDVDFSNLADGQIPKYDAQSHKWVNSAESGGTVTDVEVDGVSVVNQQGVAEIQMPSVPSNLDDLSDVDLTNIADGDTLVYDAQNQEFVPGTPSGGGSVDDVKVNGTSVVDANKVAQITSYKEVTQAQYDALPASKNSNGIAYFIKNAGDSGGVKHKYSTNEQVVGIWIDGKPLYEKCYNITLANGTIGTIDSTFIPKKFEAYMYYSGIDTGDCQSNPFVYDGSNLWTIWIDNRTITGKMQSGYVGKSAVLILQYTKTTD